MKQLMMRGYPQKLITFDPFVNGIVVILVNFLYKFYFFCFFSVFFSQFFFQIAFTFLHTCPALVTTTQSLKTKRQLTEYCLTCLGEQSHTHYILEHSPTMLIPIKRPCPNKRPSSFFKQNVEKIAKYLLISICYFSSGGLIIHGRP